MHVFSVFAVLTIAFLSANSTTLADYDDPKKLSIEAADGTPLASYTPEQLQAAFAQHEVETVIPWLKAEGAVSFRGPRLREVMAKHGLDNRDILAIAFDEYTANISVEDMDAYAPIIATEIGCREADYKSGLCLKEEKFRPLRQEENGYFRLIWPSAQLPKSSSENDPRWIWALVVLRPSS
ncbi:hypothetical protein [Phyllobacterium sp. YR531]|uniref:hypothetical protein n=1 Tax=Phyllobacterium sp. YR531 TaxID=1144343 RepID=UPI0012F652CC|nr:hypothetical protein [Phyllobacterium sp. YR531]